MLVGVVNVDGDIDKNNRLYVAENAANLSVPNYVWSLSPESRYDHEYWISILMSEDQWLVLSALVYLNGVHKTPPMRDEAFRETDEKLEVIQLRNHLSEAGILQDLSLHDNEMIRNYAKRVISIVEEME
jgi:hypothetical protein